MQTLTTRVLRVLALAPDAGPAHLSAASGVVRAGPWLYVVADDELGLGCFDLRSPAPGTLRRLAPAQVPALPEAHGARKARKPDTEALLHWPALPGCPHGALLALGSGSRPNRQVGALWALDAGGALVDAPRAVDLAPLYAPLGRRFGELNVEGALLDGDALLLLQRGHREVPVNASIQFPAAAVAAWLMGRGEVPAPLVVIEHALGTLDGVPLGFTDGTVLPDGGWLYSAAAEDTGDAYLDGACAGSVVGWFDATGVLAGQWRIDRRCKVEGLALGTEPGEVLMVTDGDDRQQPALLLAARLPELTR